MNDKLNIGSRFALSFFRWYCRPEYQEEIEGDLMEKFNVYGKKYGLVKANRLLVKEVILLFRPSIIGIRYQLTNSNIMTVQKQYKRLIIMMIGASALLLIPLIAMLFTSEVNWDLPDFLVAAFLLLGTTAVIEFTLRKVKTKRNRLFMVLAILLILFLIWAELAVGIFESPFAGS